MQMFSNKIQKSILVLFLINCCSWKVLFYIKKYFHLKVKYDYKCILIKAEKK